MKKSQSSDYINGLEKTLVIDKEGNLTAGKNLEVKGTTKLSGGIKPIHTYSLGDYTLEVLFERHLSNYTEHTFFGHIVYDDGIDVPCIGMYTIERDALTYFSAISYNSIFTLNEGGTLEEKAIATKP